MRNFLIAAAVCVAIIYALDANFFRGMYFGALGQMISHIVRHTR